MRENIIKRLLSQRRAQYERVELMDTALLEQLPEYLRSYRKKNNLSQKELAQLMGYSPSYIANLENGRQRPTADSQVVELIAKLG